MVPKIFDFASEDDAKSYLQGLLHPYFVLQAEVWCRHKIAGNRLRIDYLGKPRPEVDFPFDWFGLEVKRECRHGTYNQALQQALDYTFCAIEDTRPLLSRINGQRIERVYLFPGLADNANPEWGYAALNRFVGRYHIGLIYVDQHNPQRVAFYACADRQWEFGLWRPPR